MTASRLALGTVQFGLAYGIANTAGHPTLADAAAIVAAARSAGLDTLDTAVAYGESERRLGEIGVDGWRVISKLPPMPDDVPDVATWVRSTLRGSLDRLRLPRLGGLLLHAPRQLLEHPQGAVLHAALEAVREEGLVGGIGASVYSPEELDALRARFRFDLVQLPYNLVDRRFLQAGSIAGLKRDGVEVHVRSIFLQGLLLMPADQRPPRFARWAPLWTRWAAWCAEVGCSPLEGCVGHALATTGLDRIVVGVDSVAHLAQIVAAAALPPRFAPDDLACDDDALVNPATWKSP